VGAFFTGSIDEDGVIRLTDGFDGETWTSYGEVSGNYIRIRDYLMNLGEAGGDIPEQDIYLRR
jgi:hypothetical protein